MTSTEQSMDNLAGEDGAEVDPALKQKILVVVLYFGIAACLVCVFCGYVFFMRKRYNRPYVDVDRLE